MRKLGITNRAKKNLNEDLKVIKKHPIVFILAVVFGLGAPIFIALDSIADLILSSSVNAMMAFIEANATFLGFFAVFAVYGLTALDSRIDRMDEQIGNMKLEDLKNENNKIQSSLVYGDLYLRKTKTEEAKKRFGDIAVFAGVFMVISLATSIVALGFAGLPDSFYYKADYAFYLMMFSVLAFFASAFVALSLIHDASRKPEEIYENLVKQKKLIKEKQKSVELPEEIKLSA